MPSVDGASNDFALRRSASCCGGCACSAIPSGRAKSAGGNLVRLSAAKRFLIISAFGLEGAVAAPARAPAAVAGVFGRSGLFDALLPLTAPAPAPAASAGFLSGLLFAAA